MNIVIINPFRRYPGTERWDFELIRYEDFIDHDEHAVSYIVNEDGRDGVLAPERLYALFELVDLGDETALAEILTSVQCARGPIDRLIAFSERHLDVAARLRQRFDIPGPDVAATRRARDKVVMKQHVAEAGLRVPAFLHLQPGIAAAEVDGFIARTGFPLILKPTDGAASAGVSKVPDRVALDALLLGLEGENWELEEYIDGDVLHLDGIVDADGAVAFCMTSLYVNTCLDFLGGRPLGSITLDPASQACIAAEAFAAECLRALDFRACPFHLELFQSASGSLIFLEVAARVAGADVPYMVEACSGVNLFEHWVALILQGRTSIRQTDRRAGAWLLFGTGTGEPQRVRHATGFMPTLPSLYRELVPSPGVVLQQKQNYCALQPGRFLFAAASREIVLADVRHVLAHFRFEADSLVPEEAAA